MSISAWGLYHLRLIILCEHRVDPNLDDSCHDKADQLFIQPEKKILLCQMTKNGANAKQMPWRDWDEWISVYQKVILFPDSQAFEAVDAIAVWCSREKVPIAVEATYQFLTVMRAEAADAQVEANTVPSHTISLAYGQAVCRFVNLLVDLAQKGMVAASMDSLASQIDVPSWIIQLRHTITHGQAFPSFEVIHRAVMELMKSFIIPRYWIAQYEAIPSIQACLVGTDPGLPSEGSEVNPQSNNMMNRMCISRVMAGEDESPTVTGCSTDLAIVSHMLGATISKTQADLSRVSGVFKKLPSDSAKIDLLEELFRQRNWEYLNHILDNEDLSSQLKLDPVNLTCNIPDDDKSFAILFRLLGKVRGTSHNGAKIQERTVGYGSRFSSDDFCF